MTARTSEFRPVTPDRPCEICGKGDWCRRSDDGARECHRIAGDVADFRRMHVTSGGFGIYRPDEDQGSITTPVRSVRRNRTDTRSAPARRPPQTYRTRDEAVEAARRSVSRKHGPDVSIGGLCEYHTPTGEVSFVVVRFNLPGGGKEFRPVHLDADGWHVGDPEGTLPLFGVREIAVVDRVVVVEGELCVEAARSIGLSATTSAHGSSAPGKTDWTPLAGREVTILPDNDKAGRNYAESVARILTGLHPPARVKIVELPNLPAKGDIVDWLATRECVEPDDFRREVVELAKATTCYERRDDTPTARGTLIALNASHNPGVVASQNGRSHPDPSDGAQVVCVADVAAEKVSWLWASRIAIGKLTLFAGTPGVGKSFLSLDLAARVSTGRSFPNCADNNSPGDVVLLNCEDAIGDTVRPRLEAAGADLSRVHVIKGVTRPETKSIVHMLNLDEDIRRLEAVVVRLKPRLIIVDPLSAYLGPNADPHKDAEIRRVLGPVAQLADKHKVAIVGVVHLNKKVDVTAAVYRVGGSIALTAAARAVWLVAPDPDEDRRRTLMAQAKNNLARDPGALAYTIVHPGRLEWEDGIVDLQADAILCGKKEAKGPAPVKRDEAAQWLAKLLANGPVLSKRIKQDANECGFAWATIRRAKDAIDAVADQRTTGDKPGWYWWAKMKNNDGGSDGE